MEERIITGYCKPTKACYHCPYRERPFCGLLSEYAELEEIVGKKETYYCKECLTEFLVEQEPAYDLETWQRDFPKKVLRYCPFCKGHDIERVDD